MSITHSVIFAGGGSGGHISPGIAIAERLRERRKDVQPIFACSMRAIDREMLEAAGETFVAVPATPPSLRPRGMWRFFRNYQRSKQQLRRAIREHSARCVVALGGFVAAPAVAAAQIERVPRMLVNLDSPPGKANRFIARKCNTVVSAVPLPTMPHFASEVVGMPIRRCAVADADAATCRRSLGLDEDRLTLLVTGASQGATSLNQMMVVLAQQQPQLLRQVQILHLAGSGSVQPLRDAYAQANVQAVVVEFLHEIGLAWGAADIAVSRAGANSVAEVAANRVPAVFLPYPYHRDMHQRNNAMPLVECSGAIMMEDTIDPELNAREIGPVLAELIRDDAKRDAMRQSLDKLGKTDAADRIAQLVMQWLDFA